MSAPQISATVVLYNSAEHLGECLNSIRPAVDDGFVELIAVDNASPDDSARLAETLIPTATIVRSSSNRGFAAGANLGWPYVRGRYWLLLNPDVVLPPNGVTKLAAWMEANPDVGIASPELVGADHQPQSSGRVFPSIALTLLELSRLHKLLPKRLRAHLLKGPYWLGGDHLSADWVPGAAVIVRSDAVTTVGLLSESFFMYGEDIEWCSRFRAAGWKVGVCSEVVAVHHERGSAGRTWDAAEADRRIADGMLQAIRMRRGALYAHLYGRAYLAALWVEAHHPMRGMRRRASSRETFDVWRTATRGK